MTLTHDLASSLDSGIQTDMVVLDFLKAFDRVPHQCLKLQLHIHGFGPGRAMVHPDLASR